MPTRKVENKEETIFVFVKMKILVSSTEYSIIINLKETSLMEWLMCLEEQYPLEKN